MKRIKKMIPFIVVNILVFCILQIFIIDIGIAILLTMMLFPAICFTVSLIYGIKNSFDWLYLLFNILIFIPILFIFYDESAFFYVLIYGIYSLVGNFLGSLILSEKNK